MPDFSFFHTFEGLPLGQSPFLVIWGHGWGHSHAVFAPFVQSLAGRATHLLIDFPGFGESPLPPDSWTTRDYAEALVPLLQKARASGQKIVWVGHSFGGRVGLQMAAHHPDLIDGLFILAGAGLPRRRSLWQRLRIKIKVATFKICKRIAPLFGIPVEAVRDRFGSADYRNAGALRPVFLNVVREDLSAEARQIACPTTLVYGAADTEAPPDIGERLAAMIPGSQFILLQGHDHYSVLGRGRALVLKYLSDLLGRLA